MKLVESSSSVTVKVLKEMNERMYKILFRLFLMMNPSPFTFKIERVSRFQIKEKRKKKRISYVILD